MNRKHLVLVAIAALFASSAWALETGNTNLVIEDGSVSMTCKTGGTVSGAGILVDADGTGSSSNFVCQNSIPSGVTMDAASLTTGVLSPSRVVSSCANGYYLKMNTGGTALECVSSAGGASTQLFSLSSETKIAAAGAAQTRTAYLGLNGKVSTGAAGSDSVLTPLPSGGTFNNLRCKLDGAVTGSSASIVVALIGGACSQYSTWQATPTGLSVTMNTGDTGSQTTSSAQTFAAPSGSPTAANCVALRVFSTNTTTTPFVNCSLEKTA